MLYIITLGPKCSVCGVAIFASVAFHIDPETRIMYAITKNTTIYVQKLTIKYIFT